MKTEPEDILRCFLTYFEENAQWLDDAELTYSLDDLEEMVLEYFNE